MWLCDYSTASYTSYHTTGVSVRVDTPAVSSITEGDSGLSTLNICASIVDGGLELDRNVSLLVNTVDITAGNHLFL